MTPDNYQRYYEYLAEHVITPFYENRLNNLNQLSLRSVLKRKNPYLFKAKNIGLAGELVNSIVDAFLSSRRRYFRQSYGRLRYLRFKDSS
jgi:site-specific DNA-methyltransferase (cytosine-N4-specific)